ncbi:amino acid permease-domain-containing protein [Apiospora marii]|uniref:Amino acid permease-domain-containing protein n=1 Tax=Apiospora marii TaxID=335849 RepID=A0ABR1SHH3_9PEZI
MAVTSSSAHPVEEDGAPHSLEADDLQSQGRSSADTEANENWNPNTELLYPDRPTPRPDEGKLSLLDGLALVIGLQVGSGIFAAPSQVTLHVPSAVAGVSVWVLAGLLVWTGAASVIELGLQVPLNGGIQEYLRECYGDFAACAFTWSWIGISRPASMALITGIFADYICRAFLPADSHVAAPWLATKAVGLAGLWIITYANCTGARTGPSIAGAFMFLKLATLIGITIVGFGAAIWGKMYGPDKSGRVTWATPDVTPPDDQPTASLKTLDDALFAALFCYAGWETIGFFLGDMQNPKRDLPRALTAAISIVTVGFALVNISLYMVLPLDVIRATSTPVVVFAQVLLGTPAVVVVSLMIAASCIGALNANVYATATLCVAASRRAYLPPVFETRPLQWPWQRPSRRRGPARPDNAEPSQCKVPTIAMIMNSALASVFFCMGTFTQLVAFKGIVEYFFFFFTILGVFVLRSRQNTEGISPYRTGSWNPIIFRHCIDVNYYTILHYLSG